MPKVSPWISVGLGTLVAILLGISGVAGQAVDVFTVVGASFGPICGAMMADYLLAGRKWAGPRAGFNLAGWISWVVGFAVGGYDLIAKFLSEHPEQYMNVIWCPPMAALIVGFVLYAVLAKVGLEGKTLEMPEKDSN
jgi:cytosine permease